MSTPIVEVMTEIPHTVGSQVSPDKAREMMELNACHHLPVLEGGKLIGIISDHDLQNNNSGAEKVKDLMTDDPVTVDPKKDVFQVAMMMHEKKIGSVIVAATPYSPWGIFTSTDAVAFLAKKDTTLT